MNSHKTFLIVVVSVHNMLGTKNLKEDYYGATPDNHGNIGRCEQCGAAIDVDEYECIRNAYDEYFCNNCVNDWSLEEVLGCANVDDVYDLLRKCGCVD